MTFTTEECSGIIFFPLIPTYFLFPLLEIMMATVKPSFYIICSFKTAFQITTEFWWVSAFMVAKFLYFSCICLDYFTEAHKSYMLFVLS